jgi:hypothetical protein
MHNKNKYPCRVCGLILDEPPWGKDGETPSFDICLCCGVEFGYEDSLLKGIRTYRESWLSNGAKWCYSKSKPTEWDLNEQLKNIPSEFL